MVSKIEIEKVKELLAKAQELLENGDKMSVTINRDGIAADPIESAFVPPVDPRFVANTSVAGSTTAQVQIELAANAPLRVGYRPAGTQDPITFHQPAEIRDIYGDSSSPHLQTPAGLSPNTEYTWYIYTSATTGASQDDVPSMPWELIYTFDMTTLESAATFVQFIDFPGSGDTAESGDWDGIQGNTTPPSGHSAWERVTIPAGQNGAVGRKLLLPSTVKEAWAEYDMAIGNTWNNNTDNIKMPGFVSHITDGANGVAGGNGGGWGGLCRSWSARTTLNQWSAGQSWSGRYSPYVYHYDAFSASNNGGVNAGDHPCVDPTNDPVQSGRRCFGQTFTGSVNITEDDYTWHKYKHYVKLNDIGQSNGELSVWVDDVLTRAETGLNFTDNPSYYNIAFWFQVYSGGNGTPSADVHVFFDNFRWNAGAVNLTAV